jgi:hypothetical protein
MAATKWKSITYQQVIREALEDANKTWDDLDKQKCYTIRFTHPAMHYTKKKDVNIISYWSADSGRTFDNSELLEFTDFSKLQEYLQDFNPSSPKWGVIMRSNDSEATKENSTIILESKLMTTVRRLCYDRKVDEAANDVNIHRDVYVFILSALDQQLSEQYQLLFPETAPLMTRAKEEITSVSKKILSDIDTPSIVTYFRAQIAALRTVKNMSLSAVTDFVTHKIHISTWYSHLSEASLLPSVV